PWNYPLMMVVWKLGPALAAGNVQILKPAEQTPLTTLRFVELAQEVLPPGVVNVITGDGVPVGDGLVRHPEIALVSLTGDVETGKTIARNAADTLKRVHLELGGKAPMVVLDDADPEAVAAAVKIGGYFNSGQDCQASSRILVAPTSVADVTQDAEIVQREVFGPVVTVQRFSSDDEALELANGVRYALAASVFSRDIGRALGAARKLAFGTVWINEHLFPLTPEMPHGGFKESGYGKDMSLYWME